MAVSRRVAAQHEDWLTLIRPEAPWFSLPVLKRVWPNGLDRTDLKIRAENKVRWCGDANDRSGYLDWLLRDVLGWGVDYCTGDELAPDLAAGVTRKNITVTPTGVYAPIAPAPVGLFDATADTGWQETDSSNGSPVARPRVLVFVVPAGTDPYVSPAGDTWPATWVQRAALAGRHFKIPLALVTDGDQLTLVHARHDGVPGAGTWRASEFVTEPVLLDSFRSVLHAGRFIGVEENNTCEALLVESVKSQADVTDGLGRQVRQATELLVNALSRANLARNGQLLDGIEPNEVYQAAVVVMMRTVFLLVAEERRLLPVDNPHYQNLYAIRALHVELEEENAENPEALENRYTAWHRLLATSRAVHSGVYHDELSVSAYGGNLFDPDRFTFLEGRPKGSSWLNTPSNPISVSDLDLLAILDALLVLRFKNAGGVTDTYRLSYRDVAVEQIGYIYESLLDHGATVAAGVVLGLTGQTGEEPEISLVDLEKLRIDGDKDLVQWLSSPKAKKDRRRVGTAKQVAKRLSAPLDPEIAAGLSKACQNDLDLVDRIVPFANLLRLDLHGRPLVFRPGAVYVTEVGSRRSSGTAYTTKELADEVAEHALAPLCYSPGPQDCPDPDRWRVRPPAAILALKVCDPAVGSGAILVAACRYLADRLIEGWRADGDPRAAELATAADDPNRLEVVVEARRLVAEHCCYGVDRNPMAVEMAKLSMWLTTVAKDRPFTFLDHALKSGDALLGLWNFDQLRHLHYDIGAGRGRTIPIPGFSAGGEARAAVEELLDEALGLRQEMHEIPSIRLIEIERKEKLYRESEERLAILARIADVVTGAALTTAGETDWVGALTKRIDADAELIVDLVAVLGTPDEAALLERVAVRARSRLDAGRPDGAPSRVPLHWPIAFPEVFSGDRLGGFDLILGNPPFVGGTLVKGSAGADFRDFLAAWLAQRRTARGRADLVCYFFLAALNVANSLGFLATNSVAQGDSAEVGLRRVLEGGWTIHRAASSSRWPGADSVYVAKVWATSQNWSAPAHLDGGAVIGIDENLYQRPRSGLRKKRLAHNAGMCIIGSKLDAQGFILDSGEAQRMLRADPRNRQVVMPIVNGDDLNGSADRMSKRWAINFGDRSEAQARTFPEPFAYLQARLPAEIANKSASYDGWRKWWQYWNPRATLYELIGTADRVLAMVRHSNVIVPVYAPAQQTFTDAGYVFPRGGPHLAGALWSGHHWRWTIRYASTLGEGSRYSSTGVFETFPLPPDDNGMLAQQGSELDSFRESYMLETSQGIRAVSKQIHDPSERSAEITKLRSLQVALDQAAQSAYGFDFELGHGFHPVRGRSKPCFTFHPAAAAEVLEQLLELNQTRYQAEVAAGLHQKAKKSKPGRTKSPDQGTFDGGNDQ